MSRNIAVLMGQINIENQRQIMDGMIDAIKETKDNVYIFTNRSNRNNNKERKDTLIKNFLFIFSYMLKNAFIF
ncbi:MAG: hypothetical protein IJ958_00400 [Agathobacter sp.]|nr:hypothetical protein [Agathobacter sp.]